LPAAEPCLAPKITIVTPSFNQGRFLERCITSVLEQDYPHLEYIVIDGGSTDESVAILRRHERHFAFWVSEADAGQSDALNKGFSRATGDLLAWLNADDFFLPGAFAAVARVYREQPRASFYFGDGWRADESGRLVRRYFSSGILRWAPDALCYGLDYILQPATFMRRQCLIEAGGIDAGLHYGMDWDLWLRLARLADPVPVPACLAASREYAATKTSTGAFPRAEELRRIAERHTGLPMTPGALLYYLGTLRQAAEQSPDVYSTAFLKALTGFYAEVQRLLPRWSAGPDGFPTTRAAAPEPLERSAGRLAGWLKRLPGRLRRSA
jgi:hypothetical protein